MTRSPWARVYAQTPDEYIWGTRPSSFAREVSGLVQAGGRVLELGCGEGRDSVFFATRGLDVTAIDVSAAGLDKAERLAEVAGVRVHWIVGDAAHCAVDGAFDLVYSCGAIHYVPRRRRACVLARLKALTSPGGYHAHVVFTDHAIYRERGERVDYFSQGELSRAYSDWLIVRSRRTLIPCSQDGTSHQHGVEQFVAREGRLHARFG